MKKRIIFFFSATGNCLYVANQLKGDNGEALSIPQLVKNNEYEFEAEEIGFVYPVYMSMPPYMVEQFLTKSKLKADYFFAIATFGANAGNTAELWQELAAKSGYHFDYINKVQMADNWLHHFDMDQQKAMDKHIPEQLAKVMADLAERRHWTIPVTAEERKMHDEIYVSSGMYKTHGFRFRSEEHFVVTDACVRCGVCTKVCPRGNWRVGPVKAITGGECDYCLACIHNCPRKAIQFAKSDNPFLQPELNPSSRYRNPNVTLRQIEKANSQR